MTIHPSGQARLRSEEIHSLLGSVINIVRLVQSGRGYFSIIVISNDNQESNTDNTDQTAETPSLPSHPQAGLDDN